MEGHSEGVGHENGYGKPRYCKDLAKQVGSNSIAMDAGGLLKQRNREQRFFGTDLSEVHTEVIDESQHF